MLAPELRRIIASSTVLLGLCTGCTSLFHTTPAKCVLDPRLPQTPKSDQLTINFLRLRQDPPKVYLLAPGDVLGIYIETVLGKTDEVPPVYFPPTSGSAGSGREGLGAGNQKPALGFPVPVRDDGTISLPWIPPVKATGLSTVEVEDSIRQAYTADRKILPPNRDRIIVTLMRPRTYNVLVVRQDRNSTVNLQAGAGRMGAGMETLGMSKKGETYSLDLPAYENDVLHALGAAGGLPGVDAKNEITILRGAYADAVARDDYLAQVRNADTVAALIQDKANVVTIPLRVDPQSPPLPFTQQDIILNSGDVLFIESRDAEVFYTGGLLMGGQHPIPRDYDLDILGAIAMTGGSVASGANAGRGASAGGSAFGGGQVGLVFPPSRAVILRRGPHGDQYAIRVNLKRALWDQSERILIQPNDLIMVEYTTPELITNVGLNMLTFNYFLNGSR